MAWRNGEVASRAIDYAFAIGLTAGATLIAALLGGNGWHFLFIGAAAIGALRGGLGAGLLATVGGALIAQYRFIEPIGSLDIGTPREALQQTLYVVTAGLVTVLASHVRSARRDAELRARESLRLQALAGDEARRREESLALLDLVLAKAPVGLAFLDRDLRFVRINEALARGNAPPMEQHVSQTLREVLPRLADMVEPHIRRVLDTGEPVLDLELQGADGAGTASCLLASCYPVRSHPGELPQWVGITCVDITAMRLAEAARRQTEAGYRFLTEGLPQVVWMGAPDGTTAYVNPHWCRYTGLSEAETIESAESWPPVWHPDDVPALQAALESAAATGQPAEAEFRIRRANDGEYRWHLGRMMALPTPDGSSRRCLATAIDVHDRRLAEERLRTAQKMDAVGRLAGGVAHEINNMMTVILGFASFVAHRLRADDPVRADVEQIRRAAERSADITGQLLAYSRRAIVKPQVVGLNAVLRSMETLLQRLLGEQSVLSLRLAPVLDNVRVDPGQIEQVFLNLALNARDAMPDGGELTVQARNVRLDAAAFRNHPSFEPRPGPYVLVSFSDSGHGMDPETRSRLFEPFFTTKPVGQGTGLGLATAYGIVAQSDGYIWVYSEPGVGTIVNVALPGVRASATLPAEPPPSRTRGRGGRVLVVEDEEGVRQMMQRALEEWGFTVVTAADGAGALELADGGAAPFELVVTDLFMPGMGGRELAWRIAERQPGVAVLYTSGYTDDDIARRGLLDPGAPFLQKPFGPDQLAARVRELVDGTVERVRAR